MNLYKQIHIENYSHICFVQKMIIECPQARLRLMQDLYGQNIIDTQVVNPEDFINFAKDNDYIAEIKPFYKDGESEKTYSIIPANDIVFYYEGIRVQLENILDILKNTQKVSPPVSSQNDTSELGQLKYLLTHDEPMPHIEPCAIVKEVMDCHERYLSSHDIQIAYLYEKNASADPVYFQYMYTIQQSGHETFQNGIITILRKLGYKDEDLSWLDECYEYQLLRFFDFDWEHDRPTYQCIKETLTRS